MSLTKKGLYRLLILFLLTLLAPPLSIQFENPSSVEEGQDWETGSVTFNLTYNEDDTLVQDNVTVRCRTWDSRPQATVRWWLGMFHPK